MRIILNTLVLASFVWAAVPALAGEKDVTLYKNPQCGCCEGYADYLRENASPLPASPLTISPR